VNARIFMSLLAASATLYASAEPPPVQPAPAQQSEIAKRRTIDRDAFRASAREGLQALDAKEYAKAQTAFTAAISADPTDPRAAYNRGVAAYRSDDFPVAGESFAASGSSGDAALAASSMYNQGTASFAQALRMLPKESGAQGAQQPPDLKPAIDALKTALTHFKDAVAADQRDLDSRFNAELAQRLLRQLEKQQEEQKQQQEKDEEKEQEEKEEKEQNQDKQDQQGKQDKQDKQDQQDKQDKQSGQDQQENQEKQDQKQGQGDKPEQQQKQDQQQDQKPGDQTQAGDQKEEKDGQAKDGRQDKQDAKGDPSKAGQQEPSPKDGAEKSDEGSTESASGQPQTAAPLTREEAERLLQMVRDREKTREDAKERAKQAQPRRAPGGKDW